MSSAIDIAVPVFGSPTTASVRDNFRAAAEEISALQEAVDLAADALDSLRQALAALAEDAPYLPIAGGALSGPLLLAADPAAALGAATRQYVDALRSYAAATYLPLAGGTVGPTIAYAPGTGWPLRVQADAGQVAAMIFAETNVAAADNWNVGRRANGNFYVQQNSDRLTIERGTGRLIVPGPAEFGGNLTVSGTLTTIGGLLGPATLGSTVIYIPGASNPLRIQADPGFNASLVFDAWDTPTSDNWFIGRQSAGGNFFIQQNSSHRLTIERDTGRLTVPGPAELGSLTVGGSTVLGSATMTGPLVLAGAPATPLEAATKAYVDASSGNVGGPFLELSGGTLYAPGVNTLLTLHADTAPGLLFHQTGSTIAAQDWLIGQHGTGNFMIRQNGLLPLALALERDTHRLQIAGPTEISNTLWVLGEARFIAGITGPLAVTGLSTLGSATIYAPGGAWPFRVQADAGLAAAMIFQQTGLPNVDNWNIGRAANGNFFIQQSTHWLTIQPNTGRLIVPGPAEFGSVTASGGVTATGNAAGYTFNDRTLGGAAQSWEWYADQGAARLRLRTEPTDYFAINNSDALFSVQIVAGSSVVPWADNSNQCGFIDRAWNQCHAFHFGLVSDARLKTDFADLPAAGAVVMAVRPQRYRLRSEPPGLAHGDGPRHWGFVAQDVKAAMDAAGYDFAGHVHDRASDRQALRHSELLAVLWKAVQELSIRVTGLEGG